MKKIQIGLGALAVVFALTSAFATKNTKGQTQIFAKISGVCKEITTCTSDNNGQAGCSVTVDNSTFYSTSDCEAGTEVSAFVRQNS